MDRPQILAAAPPAPLCFSDRHGWICYLQSAQDDKVPSSRPLLADGTWNPDFSHCRDCNPQHRRTMCEQKRCHPPLNARASAFREARRAGTPKRSLRAKALRE